MPFSPYTNPGAYRDFRIGGRTFPGHIMEVRGLECLHQWQSSRPIAGTGWNTVDKGRPPIEKFEIVCCLNAATQDEADAAWLNHYKFVVFVRGKAPPLIVKPKALQMTGAPFKDVGVLAALYQRHTAAIFTVGKNLVTYEFREATKSTQIPIGPPEPAILNETNPNPTSLNEALLASNAAASTGLPVLTGTYTGINAGVPSK